MTEMKLRRQTVHLHIGPHKTGTTSIQLSLARSKDVLRRYGITYVTDSARQNANVGIHALRRRRSQHLIGGAIPPYQMWENLLQQVRNAQRAVLSAESLCMLSPIEIQALQQQLQPAAVTIVVTLRPLSKVIPSQWQQIAQNGPSPDLDEFANAVLERGPASSSMTSRGTLIDRLDHEAILRRWATVFGANNVKVIVADDKNRNHLIHAMADILDVPRSEFRITQHSNRSLSLAEVQVIRSVFMRLEERGMLPLFDDRGYMARLASDLKVSRRPANNEPRIQLTRDQAADAVVRSEAIIHAIRELGCEVFGDVTLLAEQDSDVQVAPVPRSVATELGAAALLSMIRSIGVGSGLRSKSGVKSHVRASALLRALSQRVLRRLSGL